MSQAKQFWLIAGPNGVGKTTYAFKNVPAASGSINFVNLDADKFRHIAALRGDGGISNPKKWIEHPLRSR